MLGAIRDADLLARRARKVGLRALEQALNGQGKPDPSAAPCQIELAPGALGSWSGPTQCSQGVCARTWQGSSLPTGGSAALVLASWGAWAVALVVERP